jgi:hypothetical protein
MLIHTDVLDVELISDILNIEKVLNNLKKGDNFLNNGLKQLAQSLVEICKSEEVAWQILTQYITSFLRKLTTEKKVHLKQEITLNEHSSILYLLKEMVKYACTCRLEPIPSFKKFLNDINLIETIFIYLDNHSNIVNYIFSRNFQFSCSIISNIFYYYADETLMLNIADRLYKLIKLKSLNDFNNTFRQFIYTEYIDNRHKIVALPNNSFELGKDFDHIPRLTCCYMYTKLL